MKTNTHTFPLKIAQKIVGSVCMASLLLNLAGCQEGGDNNNTSNSPPEVSGTPKAVVRTNSEYEFIPSVSDEDSDTFVFYIDNQPAWINIDPMTGIVSGVPSASDIGDYHDISISVTDGSDRTYLEPFSITVLPKHLTMDNFNSDGEIIQTQNGYQTIGTLEMTVGDQESRYENADLQLEFDKEGNLIDLVGDADLPPTISDNVSVDTKVKAKIGLYSGEEINADEDLGILLKDDMNYFVYYMSENLDITVGDRNGSGDFDSITLETPLGGEILMITDPTDVFYYYYAGGLLGDYGYGESVHGLIPFVPASDNASLDTFDGHIIEKGGFSLGVKIFDFFSITGTRVTHQPELSEIDWTDPLKSSIEYKAGLNGNADFDFSILGVGLFSFPIAATSATLDVGFDRQSMAMETIVAPDVSWAPKWFPFLPTTEIVGDWFIDGNGDFYASLKGKYQSTLPPADLSGEMTLTNDGVSLAGTIADDAMPLSISAEFLDDVTTVKVTTNVNFTDDIKESVTATLDKKLDDLQQAHDDLVQATSDYEVEVSLRGLRSALPGIADKAIATLNAVPANVRTAVRTSVINYVNNYKKCVLKVCKNPLDPLVDEDKVGTTAGNTAYNIAQKRIAPYVAAMQEMKKQALNGDDESLRNALEAALRVAYNSRTFKETIKITVKFPLVGKKTVYNETVTRTLIDAATANKILEAANNVYRITETSNIIISAQEIIDTLPVEDAINTAKNEVEQGLTKIPEFNGMGYTVANDVVEAYVILGDQRYPVEFNVLSPVEAFNGISELLSNQFLDI